MKLIQFSFLIAILLIAYELHNLRTETMSYAQSQTAFIYQRLENHRAIMNGIMKRIDANENYQDQIAGEIEKLSGRDLSKKAQIYRSHRRTR